MFEVKVQLEPSDVERSLDDVVDLLTSDMMLQAIGAGAYAHWAALAANKLHKTRDSYLNALKPPRVEGDSVVIELDPPDNDPIPDWVEEGKGAFDMKQTHLQGGRTHRVIAFGHGDTGSPPSSGSTPLGYGYQSTLGTAGARALGQRITKMAKQLSAGGRLGSGYAPVLKEGRHKTDLYAGLQKRSRGGGSSAYLTFRTLSVNSAGWQHPGLDAQHFRDQVIRDLPEIADAVVQGVLDALLGG